MVFHMLAVFGAETARAPAPLESVTCSARPHPKYPEPAEIEHQERLCHQILDQSYPASGPHARSLKFLGKGCGFSYEASPYCSYAARDGVHILFAGEVSEWPGVNAVSAAHDAFVRNETPLEEDDAHWLLDFYSTFTNVDDEDDYEDMLQKALDCLASIKGTFSFVIYDSARHRVLAARDNEGVQAMFWGVTDDGQLMFGSAIDDLGQCNPTATAFPAGTLFASERHMLACQPGERGWIIADDELPGEVLSFIKADPEHYKGVKVIPRITSKGMVCGAVYKVASQTEMGPGVSH